MPKARTFWDTFQGLYQHGPQKHRLYLLELLEKKAVESILDVGCGTGPIWELIRDLGYNFEYKGIDYSWAMIDVAKKHFPETQWEVQDARALFEPDSSWDCVLLLHCLDHLDDYKAAIAEAARVTRKYVCIVLWRSFVDEGTRLNDRNMYGKAEDEEPWEDTYLQEYSKEALEKEFAKNSLKIEEIAEGEKINDPGKWNFLYLLRKEEPPTIYEDNRRGYIALN